MKQRINRPRHAQNPIAYIVYNNPKDTQRLIDTHGYQAPDNAHDLVSATKELVRKEGKSIIKSLMAIHPDRKAILSLEKGKEDQYCGACNSYSYDPEQKACKSCGHASYTGTPTQPLLQELVELNVEALEKRYQEAVQQANEAPQNTSLSEQVRLIWNELRLRKKETLPGQESSQVQAHPGMWVHPKEALLILGLTLVAGTLIGCSFSSSKSAA